MNVSPFILVSTYAPGIHPHFHVHQNIAEKLVKALKMMKSTMTNRYEEKFRNESRKLLYVSRKLWCLFVFVARQGCHFMFLHVLIEQKKD